MVEGLVGKSDCGRDEDVDVRRQCESEKIR